MLRILIVFYVLLCGCGAVVADVTRPLDKRATARLIAAEVARQEPQARVERKDTRNQITLHLPNDRNLLIDVESLHMALREAKSDNDRQGILQDFVTKQLAASRPEPLLTPKEKFDLALAQAMPVLRKVEPPPPPQTFYDYLAATLAPVGQPFHGNTVQCWTIEELPAGFDCLNAMYFGEIAKDAMARTALANARSRMDEAVTLMSGPFHKVSLGTKFASSLMFLDEYWDSRTRGQRLIASIPTVNELIWIVAPSDAQIVELRQRTVAAYVAGSVARFQPREKVANAVSPDLYLWTPQGWQVLPP